MLNNMNKVADYIVTIALSQEGNTRTVIALFVPVMLTFRHFSIQQQK